MPEQEEQDDGAVPAIDTELQEIYNWVSRGRGPVGKGGGGQRGGARGRVSVRPASDRSSGGGKGEYRSRDDHPRCRVPSA